MPNYFGCNEIGYGEKMKIKFLYVLSIALICLSTVSTSSMSGSIVVDGTDPSTSNIAQDILAEVNRVRTDPAGYIQELRDVRKNINGDMLRKPDGTMWRTVEGVVAVDDAIKDLEKTSPLKPLSFSDGLAEAAGIQLADLKENISLGHTGKDGSTPFARIKRLGSLKEDRWGENISFNHAVAKEVVLAFIIDDGVPSRGHRKNILKESFAEIGIAYGIANDKTPVCVMVFANEFTRSASTSMGLGMNPRPTPTQGPCSKGPNAKEIKLSVGNATGKAFTVNPVNEQCQEIASKQEIPPGEMFHFTSYKDAVFRVREVGTNKLLGEIKVNPAKPEMLVQTDLDDSNSRIRYLDPK